LFDTGMLQGKPPNDLLQGKAFPSVGLATMHENLSDQSKNVALLFRSSPFGSISHSYADQNTFALDAYGEPLIIASGYYQRFGSPHHKKWTWTTAASNSVLINNQGQATRDWSSKGNLDQFISTEFADYALGSAHKAYKGLLNIFNRHIFFLRSNHANETPIVIIHDIIEGAKPITAQFLLHASNKFILDGSKQVMLKSASSACQINFVYPSLLQISQTNKFPIMPERSAQNQWHLKGATVKKKRKINSIITIQPYSLKEQYYPMDVFPEKDHSGFIGSCLISDNKSIKTMFRLDNERKLSKEGSFLDNKKVFAYSLTCVRNKNNGRFFGKSLVVKFANKMNHFYLDSLTVSSYSKFTICCQ
jgi:hypothetical protein